MSNTINPVSPAPAGADAPLQVGATRPRQTARPAQPFRDVLAGGVSLLFSGAQLATHVVAGPMMAAAVRDAGSAATAAVGGAGTPDVSSLLQDGQASNLQLLALQQQIQNESQQFSTVSNVMRAKYDTAKAAVSNIRA
jgi:hypothetical protein